MKRTFFGIEKCNFLNCSCFKFSTPKNNVSFNIDDSSFFEYSSSTNSNYSNDSDDFEDINITFNDFYIDLINIIGHPNYLKEGIIIKDDNSEKSKNWYICSTIKFNADLDDKIIVWKHIKDSKWDQQIITVKKILQLNGS